MITMVKIIDSEMLKRWQTEDPCKTMVEWIVKCSTHLQGIPMEFEAGHPVEKIPIILSVIICSGYSFDKTLPNAFRHATSVHVKNPTNQKAEVFSCEGEDLIDPEK